MTKKILFPFLIFFTIIIIIILFDKKETSLNNMNKIQIYDCNNNLIYESLNNHESYNIPLDSINPLMIKSLLEIEDKRFYNHHGFDIYSILKVLLQNKKGGASTIGEQYLKNVYFTNKRSYIRRLKELFYSIRLDRIYSKDEIIEAYLNNIYFGDNIYGIYNASIHYFNKTPKEININDIAVLIGLINSPVKYNPIYNYDSALKKRNQILNKLYKGKIINYQEYINTINKGIIINEIKINMYTPPILYYKDLVLSEYKALKIKSKFNKTIKIYTSYDSNLNNKIYTELKNRNIKSDISIYILNNKGYILSNIGNTIYSKFNPSILGVRDIGSTIKPLIYYTALKKGISMNKKLESKPTTFIINNEEYKIHNYNNIYPTYPIDMTEALATSDNIYAFKMLNLVGPYSIINLLKGFNINTKYSPYLALGNIGMSLAKITSIYNTISTKGYYYKPNTIRYVSSNNKTIYKNYSKGKKILDSNICIKLSNMMQGMFNPKIKRATGLSIAQDINYHLAGKSGLTDFDSYMIGFNPLYTIGVWCGYIDNSPLLDLDQKRLSKIIFSKSFNTLMEDKADIWY